VPLELQRQAEMAGATVVDRSSVITTHLAEVVRQNAADLLGREDVRLLVEMVRARTPSSSRNSRPPCSPGRGATGAARLLAENVSIRDLVRIFEALSVRAKVSTDVDGLGGGRPDGARVGDQPPVRHARRAAARHDPRPGVRAAPARGRAAERGPVRSSPWTPARSTPLVNGCTGLLTDAERLGLAPVLVCSAPGPGRPVPS
jgi:flagellar biosynthesis protein FlhA